MLASDLSCMTDVVSLVTDLNDDDARLVSSSLANLKKPRTLTGQVLLVLWRCLIF